MTNAVKHFKFVRRGKRRIHESPNRTEINACRPWLVAELKSIDPLVVVVLGAAATKALLGSAAKVTELRGQMLSCELAPRLVATVHPSSVLRVEGSEERKAAFDALVADLRVAAEALASQPKETGRPRHAA